MSDRLTVNAGLLYAAFSCPRKSIGQTAVFNLWTLQLDYPGDEPGTSVQEGQLRPAYRRCLPPDGQRRYPLPARGNEGLDPDGGHHDAVHDAELSVSADRCLASRTLDNVAPAFVLANGPTVTPVGLTPTAGLGQGVFTVDGTLVFGLRETVERVGPARVDGEHGHRSLLPRVEDRQHRDPGQQHEPVDGGTADARADTPEVGPQPVFRDRSPLVLDRRPDDHEGPAPETYSYYTAVSFYRNNVGTTNYQGFWCSASGSECRAA